MARPLPRRGAAAALAACAALALTACGDDAAPTAGSATAEQLTTGPISLQNCDTTVELAQPAQRAIAISQPAIELLLTLGLSDRMAGAAGWNDPVPAKLEAENAKVEQLGKDYPSLEKTLDQNPDLVYSTFAWGFTDEGVAPRERFEKLGVATYQSPSECGGQDAQQTEPLTMDDVYAEVADVSELFGVQDRGDALVETLRDREQTAADGLNAGDVTLAWWYAATKTPYIAGCCGAPGIITRAVGAKNAFGDNRQLWPEITWESILDRDPDVLVLADLSRGGDGDSAKAKLAFLERDPVASRLTAVRERRYIIVSAAEMDPGIRNVDGIENVAAGLRKLGVAE